jgi:hypothetical protein
LAKTICFDEFPLSALPISAFAPPLSAFQHVSFSAFALTNFSFQLSQFLLLHRRFQRFSSSAFEYPCPSERICG